MLMLYKFLNTQKKKEVLLPINGPVQVGGENPLAVEIVEKKEMTAAEKAAEKHAARVEARKEEYLKLYRGNYCYIPTIPL
jgi:hypothetical protein